MKEIIIEKIFSGFSLNEKEKKLVQSALIDAVNMDRFNTVVDTMIEYHMQNEVLIAYVIFQCFKFDEKKGAELAGKLTESQIKLYEIFKILRNVRALSKSGEAEDVRRMFVAICQDIRVVIVKFATLLYDLKLIKNPMTDENKVFVNMISEIFAPLAERLGLSMFKSEFEDRCFELLQPEAFEQLKNNAFMKTEDNQKQIELTHTKLQQILNELKIKKGEIQARQKHFYSVYKKLVKNNITLGKVYDLVAMRVLVPTVEDCYSVFGKIHSIYKPIQGRVKDYISYPKPNGYQSLHTTIVADNNRPLEIQIRTFDMHRQSEYGIAAHWIYKEKRGQNRFDQRMTWFRQMLENANELSSDEFLETLKIDLYGEAIVAQTPKGKILEFPLGATVIDFAYAIHSEIGNTCVGGKINGKIVPIITELSNGDVVEILTNPNSKGPSRDWLSHVKTSGARSKIRAFFKTELKDENVKIGKGILEQAVKARNLNISKIIKEEYLHEIAKSMVIEELDVLYAEIGAGSLSANSIVGRLLTLYNKEKSKEIKENIITVKKNQDGILVDGDSGLLVRYAGCCTPVTGDEIIGYISRGIGVTIHRRGCANLKFLEEERLIRAEWQSNLVSNFTAVIKVHADNTNAVVTTLNNISRDLKSKLKGFGYKEIKDELVFDIVVLISNKQELESIIKNFENVRGVRKVYRSE